MLKKEKTVGKIILDHLSIEFTSVKFGMVIFSCDARLRSRLFFWVMWHSSVFRPKLCLASPALRYCRVELSYVSIVFRGSLRPRASSETPMSFLISKVPKRMFSCGSICPRKRNKFVSLINLPKLIKMNKKFQIVFQKEHILQYI